MKRLVLLFAASLSCGSTGKAVDLRESAVDWLTGLHLDYSDVECRDRGDGAGECTVVLGTAELATLVCLTKGRGCVAFNAADTQKLERSYHRGGLR